MQRSHCFALVLALAAFAKGLLDSDPLLAEVGSNSPTTSKMVARLESRNKEPGIRNSNLRPSFDAGFDWTEQRRVWNAIKDLIGAAASEWESLTANIESKSYCITIETEAGFFYNWTVGRVCHSIVSRTLSEPYFRALDPMTLEFYRKFRNPDFAREPKELKEWLHARRGKTIAQLQADACDWAIEELSKQEDENRERWILAIRETANKLRDGGEPILYEGFGVEEFRPCKIKEPECDPFGDDPRLRES